MRRVYHSSFLENKDKTQFFFFPHLLRVFWLHEFFTGPGGRANARVDIESDAGIRTHDHLFPRLLRQRVMVTIKPAWPSRPILSSTSLNKATQL